MERGARTRLVILMIIVAAAAAALIGAVISSQATAASPTPVSASGGTGKTVFKLGWMEPPDNMNPFIGWSNTVYEIYTNEYLRFVGRDTETLKPDDKGVAKSWEVSPDGLTWTFKINEDITWHDGEPLTAEDVAFTFNYIIDNDMPLLSTATTYIDKAVVVDPYTVQILCSKPKANMLTAWMIILPEHIWSKISPKDAANKFQNLPPVIGDGPWQVVEWKRNDYVRLVANKDYYLGPPKIDELLFIQYENADTMVQDLEAGNLDAAYLIPQAQYKPLEKMAGIDVVKYTFFNWDYLGFNCYKGKSRGNPVLLDQRFRAALEYAIDRQSIVDIAYYGYALPGYTFLPPGDWTDPDYSWQPPEGMRRDFDLTKANQLLDEAGYKMGPDGVRLDKRGKPIVLRLWSTNASPEGQRASKLIAGWFKDVGIKIKLAIYDDGVYYDRLWNYEGDTFVPDFDMYLWSWDGYTDPGQTYDCFTTDQIENNNEFAWSNKEYDRLDEVQSATLDPNQRAEVMKQIQQVMYEDCPAIVLTHPYKLSAYRSDKWTGWQQANYGKGPYFAGQINPWSYYNLEPKTATSDTGPNSALIAAIVVAVAAGVVVLVLLARRGRRAGAEEE